MAFTEKSDRRGLEDWLVPGLGPAGRRCGATCRRVATPFEEGAHMRAPAAAARGEGVPASRRVGFGAQPRLIAEEIRDLGEEGAIGPQQVRGEERRSAEIGRVAVGVHD